MEELQAYWHDSDLVAEEHCGAYALQIVVARAARKGDSRGEACCFVGEGGKPVGTFYLKRDEAGAFAVGYLMPAVGEVFRFDRLDLPSGAAWKDLAAIVRKILAMAYVFPDEWRVRHERFALPSPER